MDIIIPQLTADGDEAITRRRFVCENHDAPGACTEECAWLVDAMSPTFPSDFDYDPTGCHNPAPAPREEFQFDAEAKAVFEVTFTPVEMLADETYQRLLDARDKETTR